MSAVADSTCPPEPFGLGLAYTGSIGIGLSQRLSDGAIVVVDNCHGVVQRHQCRATDLPGWRILEAHQFVQSKRRRHSRCRRYRWHHPRRATKYWSKEEVQEG